MRFAASIAVLGFVLASPVKAQDADVAAGLSSTGEHVPDEAPGPLRVVVRVTVDLDRALLGRVRGQASDLDVLLVTQETASVEARLPAQLDRADRLVSAANASVAVWFVGQTGKDAVTVLVSEPESDRVLVRPVGTGEPGTPSSGTLESAALVVRGALQALIEGQQVGVTREEAVAAARVDEPPTAEEPPEQDPVDARAREQLAWLVGAGFQGAFDGHSSSGELGPTVSLGLVYGDFEATLRGSYGLSSRRTDEGTTLRLRRHGALVRLGYRIALSEAVVLVPALRAGAVVYTRKTEQTVPEATATAPTRIPSLLVGPEVRLEVWVTESLGLSATLAADMLPQAPELGIDAEGQFRPIRQIWHVQPVGIIELQLLL